VACAAGPSVGLAAQQFEQHFLVARKLRRELRERLRRLGAAAQAAQAGQKGQGERSGPYQRRVRRGARRPQRGHRIVAVYVADGARCAVPQPEPGLGRRERLGVVAGPGPRGGLGGAEQDRGAVDLLLGRREPVAGRGAGDDVGAELGPDPGDEDLERLGRILGLFVRPESVHQPRGTAPGAQVVGEEGEQTAHPGPDDLPVPVGNPRQQGQLDGRPSRLASPSAAELSVGRGMLRK
jgi:hypothetical protein